jgi:hypothetical protein
MVARVLLNETPRNSIMNNYRMFARAVAPVLLLGACVGSDDLLLDVGNEDHPRYADRFFLPIRTLVALFTVVSLGACGPGTSDEDGGLRDTPAADVPVADIDMDGDGVVARRDCDDNDSAVTSTASRACTGACGMGTESCTDGTWGACSAPTDCVCTTEGETRIGTCGRCGMQSQTCTSGRWTGMSACLGEGVCTLGAVESRDTLRCGTEERLCGATCAWGEWLQAEPDRECIPGDPRTCPDNPLGLQMCGEDCRWIPTCF